MSSRSILALLALTAIVAPMLAIPPAEASHQAGHAMWLTFVSLTGSTTRTLTFDANSYDYSWQDEGPGTLSSVVRWTYCDATFATAHSSTPSLTQWISSSQGRITVYNIPEPTKAICQVYFSFSASWSWYDSEYGTVTRSYSGSTTYELVPNPAPQLQWTFPNSEGDQTISPNSGTTWNGDIIAGASDDGRLVDFRIYNGIGTTGTVLCSNTPNAATVTLTCPGTFTTGTWFFTAYARDEFGKTNTYFTSVSIQNGVPVLANYSPEDESVFTANVAGGWQGTATVNATDPEAGSLTVKFHNGVGTGAPILCTDTTPPYTCDYTWPVGNHLLTYSATDATGAVASYFVGFTVENPVPTIGEHSPADGDFIPSNVAQGWTGVATVAATDPNGQTLTVRFYDGIGTGGTVLCTDTAAPYTCSQTWTSGGHFITYHVTDASGATDSYFVYFTVGEPEGGDGPGGNEPPRVFWTTPQDEGTYPTGEDGFYRVTAEATATDPDGTVTHARFYNGIGTNSVALCTDTIAPYTCDLAIPIGTHFYTASATDNLGEIGSYFIVLNVVDGSACDGNCDGLEGDQDADGIPDNQDPDQGGDSSPDASVAVQGLRGFDVDPTGNVIITRQHGDTIGEDDVRTYSGATLAQLGQAATQCGERDQGVAAMHTHVTYAWCSNGGFLDIPYGELDEIHIRSPSLGPPTQTAQCRDGSHCVEDIPRGDLDLDDSLRGLATVADYPIDWSNEQDSWDDFANNNLAWAFTTTHGEVGVAVLSQRNNAMDRHDSEKRNIGGAGAPDTFCSVRDSDGRSYIYASNDDSNVRGYEVKFDFRNDWLSGHHFNVDFEDEFAGTVGTAAPKGLACGDGKLAILNANRLTLWRRGATTPYVTMEGVQDPELRGVAMSEDGNFVAYTDGGRINILNTTTGSLVYSVTKPSGQFYALQMQCNGGAVWVAGTGAIWRWDIWEATAGTDQACEPPQGGTDGESCGSGCNGGGSGSDPNGNGGTGGIGGSGSYGCNAGGMLSLICQLSGITQFMLGLGLIAGAAWAGHALGSGSPLVVLFFGALGLVAATVFGFVPGWVIIAIGAIGVVIVATSWIRSVKAVRT